MTDREEADGLITNAFQHVLAGEERDYTDIELEELLFSMAMAAVQIRKLPGGADASRRIRDRVEREMLVRNTAFRDATARSMEDYENGRFVRYGSAAALIADLEASMAPSAQIGSARDALKEALEGWERHIGGWNCNLATAEVNQGDHDRIAAIRKDFNL